MDQQQANSFNKIKIHQGNIDWKEAIKMGVTLLNNFGIATMELADKIIESTEKLGPYYVLMPKVALAHTNFGSYNQQVGISLVVFKNPIAFSDKANHQVNLLFTLSAIDANSHIDTLMKFANVINNEQIVESILNAPDEKAIYALIREFM
ncbi:MAG: PTS sugar transporter subunit IIA [Mycoplasmoidaceae bacterium]